MQTLGPIFVQKCPHNTILTQILCLSPSWLLLEAQMAFFSSSSILGTFTDKISVVVDWGKSMCYKTICFNSQSTLTITHLLLQWLCCMLQTQWDLKESNTKSFKGKLLQSRKAYRNCSMNPKFWWIIMQAPLLHWKAGQHDNTIHSSLFYRIGTFVLFPAFTSECTIIIPTSTLSSAKTWLMIRTLIILIKAFF